MAKKTEILKPEIIKIKDELSLNNVTQVKKFILNKIKNKGVLILELKNIKYIDMAGIQLLLSLKKTFKKNEQELKIITDLSKDMINLLLTTGFDELVKTTEI